MTVQTKTRRYAAAIALAAIVPLGACNKSDSNNGPGGLSAPAGGNGQSQTSTSNGGTSVLRGGGTSGSEASNPGGGLGAGSGSGSSGTSGSGSSSGSSGSGSSGLGGGSDPIGGGSYCATIRSADRELSGVKDVKPSDSAAMRKFVVHFKRIEESAPADVRDDWKLVREVLEVGASGDLSKLQGIDMKQFEKATDNIEKSVKSRCGITLGTGSKSR